MKSQTLPRAVLFLLALAAYAMLSPKWTVSLAAWVAPGLLIYAIKDLKPWKAYAAATIILFLSSLLSLYKVMPFPGVIFVVITFVTSLQAALPYWINRLLSPRLPGWVSTLIFPFALTSFEYVSSFGGGGTWGSIAYTQMSNLYLMQTASLVGIWGITFVIGWFASIAVWAFEQHWNWATTKQPIYVFASLCLVLVLFGTAKLNGYFNGGHATVRVAGITGTNLTLLQEMYSDAYGEQIEIREEDISQTSGELATLQKGLAAFIEKPDGRFKKTSRKIIEHQDSLFAVSAKEAAAGSKIIVWSEALAMVLKQDETKLMGKGSAFAAKQSVYFLMTFAAMHPGKIEFGKKFIENKAVLFGPDGKVLTTFFKNKPVPMVEPSVAGDGNVPVISTPYGNLGISICYDADFPGLMRQLSQKDADILLLPSGDWREVSPYHAQMASIRAVENGVSLVRPVSFAQSIATDENGRLIGSRNFYDKGEKVLVAYIPINRIRTLYAIVGDSFATMSLGLLVMFIAVVIGQEFKIRLARKLRVG
jgi:apolipoprotein N-acyltransferase